MQNKKGLSDIVSNVLIILLVIVAIGIIWAFVGPLITQSGSRVQAGAACLNLVLTPTSCIIDGTKTNVTVKWDSGEGNLAQIKILYDTADGKTTAQNFTTTIGQGEANVFVVNAAATKVAVAAGLRDATTNKIGYCKESGKFVCQ